MFPVQIDAGGVSLREFRQDDAPSVAGIVGDERVVRWLSFDPRDREASDAMLAGILRRATQNPRAEYYLAITLADKVIGFVRLGLGGVQAAKLGYAVHADHWNHGYASLAARAAMIFAFTQLGVHRVSAAIGPDNAASLAVVRRLGMSYEGRLRDHVYTSGSWRDSLLYSALSHEWDPL